MEELSRRAWLGPTEVYVSLLIITPLRIHGASDSPLRTIAIAP
jgi:hypothetical protein